MAVIPADRAGRSGAPIPPAAAKAVRTRSLWYDAWLRLRRNRAAMISAYVLLALAVIAIIYPILEPTAWRETVRDPVTGRTIANQPPSAAHWFGTDGQSRDVFARVMYGTRI